MSNEHILQETKARGSALQLVTEAVPISSAFSLEMGQGLLALPICAVGIYITSAVDIRTFLGTFLYCRDFSIPSSLSFGSKGSAMHQGPGMLTSLLVFAT